MKQSYFRLELWMVSLGVIGIGYLIGFLVPETRSASPSVAYQQAMVNVIAAIFRLVGSVLLLISIFLAFRKIREITKCAKCGAIPKSKDDKFCRTCGEILRH